jgi:hypothetical protein
MNLFCVFFNIYGKVLCDHRAQVALGRFRVRRPLLWIKWMLWTTHLFSLGKFSPETEHTKDLWSVYWAPWSKGKQKGNQTKKPWHYDKVRKLNIQYLGLHYVPSYSSFCVSPRPSSPLTHVQTDEACDNMTALMHFVHVRQLHRCCCPSSDVSFMRFISEPFLDEQEINDLKKDLDRGRCHVLLSFACVIWSIPACAVVFVHKITASKPAPSLRPPASDFTKL